MQEGVCVEASEIASILVLSSIVWVDWFIRDKGRYHQRSIGDEGRKTIASICLGIDLTRDLREMINVDSKHSEVSQVWEYILNQIPWTTTEMKPSKILSFRKKWMAEWCKACSPLSATRNLHASRWGSKLCDPSIKWSLANTAAAAEGGSTNAPCKVKLCKLWVEAMRVSMKCEIRASRRSRWVRFSMVTDLNAKSQSWFRRGQGALRCVHSARARCVSLPCLDGQTVQAKGEFTKLVKCRNTLGGKILSTVQLV